MALLQRLQYRRSVINDVVKESVLSGPVDRPEEDGTWRDVGGVDRGLAFGVEKCL